MLTTAGLSRSATSAKLTTPAMPGISGRSSRAGRADGDGRRRDRRGRRERAGHDHADEKRHAGRQPDGEPCEPPGHFSHIISFSSLSWVPPGPNRCESVCVFEPGSRVPGRPRTFYRVYWLLVLETIARMEHLMFRLLLSVVVAALLAHGRRPGPGSQRRDTGVNGHRHRRSHRALDPRRDVPWGRPTLCKTYTWVRTSPRSTTSRSATS